LLWLDPEEGGIKKKKGIAENPSRSVYSVPWPKGDERREKRGRKRGKGERREMSKALMPCTFTLSVGETGAKRRRKKKKKGRNLEGKEKKKNNLCDSLNIYISPLYSDTSKWATKEKKEGAGEKKEEGGKGPPGDRCELALYLFFYPLVMSARRGGNDSGKKEKYTGTPPRLRTRLR